MAPTFRFLCAFLLLILCGCKTTATTSTPPETAVSTSTPPETAVSTSTPPEATVSTSTPPETTVSASTPPETAVSTSIPPETTVPTSAPPETTVPTSAPPETTVPTSAPSETTVPTSAPPETTGPPTATPAPPETTGPPTATPVPKDRVFPGNLDLSIPFDEQLNNILSELFKNKSKAVTDDIKRAFDDPELGYRSSRVLKFEPLPSSRLWSRAEPNTRVSVEISFTLAAKLNKTTVFEELESFSKTCFTCTILKNITAVATSLCTQESCDSTSSKCFDHGGIEKCICHTNFVASVPDKFCVACPSGEKAVNGECKLCSFGHSGFNCNENWKLLLVIVGSLLGGLLLITFIALVTVLFRSKKHRKAGHDVVMGKPYTSHFSPQVNRSAGINHQASANIGRGAQAVSGIPRIPRASANRSWDGGANLEMTPSSSRQNLISNGTNSYYGDHDNVATHGQNRSQNNPYSQNRLQSNPYSSVGGQDNPHYKYDSR